MALEAGGRLVHAGGSKILWTSGSYERDDLVNGPDFSHALAQSDDNDYGKVMDIDFLTGETQTLAKGLRNPQGISIDQKQQIWVTDHGMRGGDELNLVKAGANFGFPAVTYGTKYTREPAGNLPRHANHDGYDPPIIAFVPSIGPSSVIAVRNFHYTWDGDALVGAYDGRIYRAHVESRGIAYVEPIDLKVRTRDLVMLSNGTIAVWTDDRRLIYLSVSPEQDNVETFEARLTQLAPKHLANTARSVFKTCLQCHSLDKDDHGIGPSLWNVCGSTPGSGEFKKYSGALGQVGGKWTADVLADFISNPQKIAPGTSMEWDGLENRQILHALGEALCETRS